MRAAAAACLLLLGAAACGRRAEDPAARIEFDRHLRLALEGLRRDLPESAAAELEKCGRIRPHDPEVLFQLARLKLAPAAGRADAEGAMALLARALALQPKRVKILRLLSELEARAGKTVEAGRHAEELRSVYGPLGAVELAAMSAITPERLPEEIRAPQALAGAPEVRELMAAMVQISSRIDHKPGTYDPDKGVPRLQALFDRYDDLAALRLYFARDVLSGWVRVSNLDQEDKPYWSSKVILSIVIGHLEKASDMLDPKSPAALQALALRTEAAIRMGDLDDAIALSDIVIRWPAPDGMRREFQGYQALCLMKKGKAREAVRLLELSLKGGAAGFNKYYKHLWMLRLAQEQAAIPPAKRGLTFQLRPGIETDTARSPLFYKDVGAAHGLDKLLGLGPAAWGDYDGDGDDDLFLSGLDTYGTLLRNDGGVFSDASREAGLWNARSGFSATFSDYDNDGRPDLYIGRLGWSGPAPNSLYHNEGGTFVEVTTRAGVGDPGSSFVHTWSDVDRDGFLDLFVADGCTGYGDTNKFYHNNGDGTFTDATRKAGLQELAGTRTVGAVFGDYDLDGWPDLFVPGFNRANRLYRNRGDGTFEDVAKKAGVQDLDHSAEAFLGFFLDYDNDGYPDILRTTDTQWETTARALSDSWDAVPEKRKKDMRRSTPRLYRNNHDGTFSDVSDKAGFRHPMAVMGAMVGDLDNDGYVDAYFATGTPEIIHLEPDRFFRNNGDGTFSDLTFAAGLGNVGKGHGTTFIDLDGDGELEIFVNEGGFVMGDPFPTAYYRNEKPTGNHWLHVDLQGTKSNRDAVGAQLLVSAGTLRMRREASNGEGFGSSNPRTVHFGLGKNPKAERLEIRWPSGLVQVFTDLPADQRVFVREGEGWVPRALSAPSRGKRR